MNMTPEQAWSDYLEAVEVLECVYTTLLTTEIGPKKAAEVVDLLKKGRYWLDRAHALLHGKRAAAVHELGINPDCPIHGDGLHN